MHSLSTLSFYSAPLFIRAESIIMDTMQDYGAEDLALIATAYVPPSPPSPLSPVIHLLCAQRSMHSLQCLHISSCTCCNAEDMAKIANGSLLAAFLPSSYPPSPFPSLLPPL